MLLEGKAALITGGNSGIGLATARLFAAEGARVAITGRNQETLTAAAKAIGPKAIALNADVTDYAAMQKVAAAAAAAFGKLDVVFANAGIGDRTPLGATTPEAFEKVIATNLTAVFFTVQAALPYLPDGASIILASSNVSTLGSPGYSAYGAAKAGVRALGRVLASELSPRRIRVNVLTPGATDTAIWSGVAPTPEAYAGLKTWLSNRIPLARLADPDEIAKAALFLASDQSSFMQGADVVVDGGAASSPGGTPVAAAR